MPDVIGFIGAGQLGRPMVRRLLGAGHPVLVYARREEVRDRLKGNGASLADSVADVARQCDIVITCLFSDAQFVEVATGADGLMANVKPGTVLVSHTTGTASTLNTLATDFPDGPIVLDGPVSGTADDIAAGKLTVLLGGDPDAVERVRPVLAAYADPLITTGALGSALNLKLINNILFAANAQLVAAAIEVGRRLEIRDGDLLDALAVCSGGSRAAASVQLAGGLDNFAKLAAPYLRKDVAAGVVAAEDGGVDLGRLRDVVQSGPLSLS